jgi:hypothetical protein
LDQKSELVEVPKFFKHLNTSKVKAGEMLAFKKAVSSRLFCENQQKVWMKKLKIFSTNFHLNKMTA